jgi:hypothetical protein
MNRATTCLAACALLAACGGGSDDGGPAVLGDVPETVAIGVLPDPLSNMPTLPAPPAAPATTAGGAGTTVPGLPKPIEGPISGFVLGDRVLMIGDSLLASAAPRNNRLMCDAMTVFGWDAEIDAEPGRGLEFADQVLDARLEPDGEQPWDVVVLMFGNEIDPDDDEAAEQFEVFLDATIERVAPRPTLLYTLSETETEAGRARLNRIIRDQRQSHPNVVVIDWADVGGDPADVVDEDGLALTDDGTKRLSVLTAAALGEAPDDPLGDCLPTEFDDDDEG